MEDNNGYVLDEIAKEVYTELVAEEEKIFNNFIENYNLVKNKIGYDVYHLEEYLGGEDDNFDYVEHVGFVEVEISDFKSHSYPNHIFYSIIGEGSDKVRYMKQGVSDKHKFHAMVFQTTGYCEDDYSGFMLFPLTDGTYWKVRYWS